MGMIFENLTEDKLCDLMCGGPEPEYNEKEVKNMTYAEKFTKSDLTYTDVAHELGVCELSARNKINGKARITRAEEKVLDQLFGEVGEECSTESHNN